jgi:hypothetical protein
VAGRLLRIVAVLMLAMAAAEGYACDLSDACLTGTAETDRCDAPLGDNCLCCCNHLVPGIVFRLAPADAVYQEPPPEPVAHVLSRSLPIDHPPQL